MTALSSAFAGSVIFLITTVARSSGMMAYYAIIFLAGPAALIYIIFLGAGIAEIGSRKKQPVDRSARHLTLTIVSFGVAALGLCFYVGIAGLGLSIDTC